MPILSIVVPTLKEGRFIERTLKNFESLSIPHELIVSDGGSTDDTVEIARKYTDKIVVWDNKERRQTFGEAKNMGASLATGKYLVFIDADVVVPNPQKFFEEMIRLFEAHPHLVASTVPLRPWPENKSLADRIFSEPLNIWYVFSNNILHFGNASGEFQMFRREAFKKIGGYREDLGGGEDAEMFIRIAHIGRTLSYPWLHIEHSCRRAHKVGWIKLYYMWMKQGFTVLILNRTAYKEWSVIR